MLALLEKASVYVHLDPRAETVHVPPWFKTQPQLVLQLGLNLAVPIRDLDVGDEAVACTLSFNRSPFYCVVPWSSVYALVGEDGRGMMWPDDIPPEVAATASNERARSQSAAAPKRRASLRAVEGVSESASVEPSAKSGGAPEGAKVPRQKRTASARAAAAVPPTVAEPAPAPARLRAVKAPPTPLPKPRLVPRSPPGPRLVQKQPIKPARPSVAVTPAEPAKKGPAGGASKSRKKLPPYLRVVK